MELTKLRQGFIFQEEYCNANNSPISFLPSDNVPHHISGTAMMEISKLFLWRDGETARRGDETARRDGETAWRDGETAESRGPKICTVIFKFLDTSFLDIFWASFSLAIRARRGVGRDGDSAPPNFL